MARLFIDISLGHTVQKTVNSFREDTRKFDAALKKLIETTAINVQRDTVSPSGFPFITGFLRGSYRTEHKREQYTSYVFSIAEYAPNVEYGYGQPAQPFFEPALDKHEELYEKALTKLFEIYDK